jgi:hypothetical protein
VRPLGLLLLILVALLVVSGSAAAFPTRVQAVADEFTLTLSRQSVPNRRVKIELANFGEDAHDLKLRRVGGTRTFAIPETQPGEQTTRTFRLRPGSLPRLVLGCGPPRAGHARHTPGSARLARGV